MKAFYEIFLTIQAVELILERLYLIIQTFELTVCLGIYSIERRADLVIHLSLQRADLTIKRMYLAIQTIELAVRLRVEGMYPRIERIQLSLFLIGSLCIGHKINAGLVGRQLAKRLSSHVSYLPSVLS